MEPTKQDISNGVDKLVMIIEDDQYLIELIADEFDRAGWKNIAKCPTAAIGLSQMKEKKPALVLLDMLLPGMNGLELLKLKNADPNIAAIPVIVISNLGSKEEVDEATKLGVKNYIVKANFSPKDIVEKAGSILGGK